MENLNVKEKGITAQNMHVFMTFISVMVFAIHVGFFFLLSMAGAGKLAYVNFFSLLIYTVCGINFHREKYIGFSYFLYFFEIAFFSTLMTWCIKVDCGFEFLLVSLIPFSGLLGYMYEVKFRKKNRFFYYGVFILSFILALNCFKAFSISEVGIIPVNETYAEVCSLFCGTINTVCMAIIGLVYFSIAKSNHDNQDLKIEKLSLKLFITLSQTVEAKDIYTNGHSIRVASYSEMIAKKMGLSKEEQRKIYFCGLLHDIGKISIADSIINKAGKLTDEEYNEIKTHPESGWNILQSMDEFPELAQVARWHHERYDGKGYPDGKIKDETPLYVRIVTVADAYDAMTSNRSYRSLMEREKVLSILKEERGFQFDPDVCDVFLKILQEDKNYDMREKESDNISINDEFLFESR